MTEIPLNKIRKEDVLDSDFVDAIELASDGYSLYRTCNILSIVGSTKTITINPVSSIDLLDFGDQIVQNGDTVLIYDTAGSLPSNKIYKINNIIDSYNFTVFGDVLDSIDGYVDFYHPPGASKVGVDNSNLNFTTKKTVQEILEDLSTILTPTDVGQMLISDDSDNLQFKAKKPTITSDGSIISDEFGNIIVI